MLYEDYLKLRTVLLNMRIQGLTRSKLKAGKDWNYKDEIELVMMKTRKREIEKMSDAMHEKSCSIGASLAKFADEIEKLKQRQRDWREQNES